MSQLIECRVVYVDTERLTMDCISRDGCKTYNHVSYSGIGTCGEGIEIAPDVGSSVVIEMEGGQGRLVRAHTIRGHDGAFSKIINFMRRKVLNTPFARRKLPGDVSISATNGAGALFGRGRSASIFSGDLAQLHVLGIMNTIKAVASNYDIIGSGVRAFSVNEDGKVLTRLCFSSNGMAKASNTAPGYEADGCEFQIDVDGPNLTIFAGPIGKSGKRENRIIASFFNGGEVIIRCGKNISKEEFTTEFRLGDGFIRETVFADKFKAGISPKLYERVVSKSMGATENQRAMVEENIVGSVVRTIMGDLTENVQGTYTVNADQLMETGLKKQSNFNIKNTWAAINTDEQQTNVIKSLDGPQ